MTHINPERLFLLEHVGFDKKMVRAKGHYLYDSDGRAYLDFLAQYGAVPLGHNPTAIWDTVSALRINEAPSLVQPFISPAAEELAEALIAASPIESGYVTYANSGAETVEVAIKLARARTGRKTILATLKGFHGKTLGAVSATGNSLYREPFLIDLPHFEHVPYGDLDALARRLESEDVAAFIVEPIQGEAGMITPPQGYMTAAAELCRKARTLFVLDEVQTGLGRTGRLFAAEHENVRPDVLLLAKALGGGLVSIGACLWSEDAWTSQFGNYHSSTFANNHLTCSIGLATLRLLQQRDQELVEHVRSEGLHLRRGLERLVAKYAQVFSSVDGKGLMQGLVLAPWDRHDSYFLTHASDTGFAVPLVCGHLLHEHGILTAPTFNGNNVLRLEPPLTIETAEVERLLSALESTARTIADGDFIKFFEYITGTPRHNGVAVLVPVAKSVKPNVDMPVPAPAFSTAADRGARCLGKFAFLIHYTEMDDLVLSGPPGFAHLDPAPKERWVDWMRSWSARRFDAGVACHVPAIHSKKGGYAEGWLIAAPLMPRQMLRLRPRDREALIKDYVDTAKRLEVDMLGLGAFTSIITRNGADVADCGLHVTTGNSLTAVASVESLKSVLRGKGRDIAAVEAGVIGAAGSVGRLVCKMLARECSRLTLFGNPQNPGAQQKLQTLAGELYRDALQSHAAGRLCPLGQALAAVVRGRHALQDGLATSDDPAALLILYRHVEAAFEAARDASPIRITVDLSKYLPHIEAVVSATSQGNPFINASLLMPGAVVCDVARPPDLSKLLTHQRSDALVYEGGLMRFPEEVTFGSRNVIGTAAGFNLACLAETVVLTMAGIRRNYSMAERPPLADAEEIFRLATAHGFSVAPVSVPKRVNSPKTEPAAHPREPAARVLSLGGRA